MRALLIGRQAAYAVGDVQATLARSGFVLVDAADNDFDALDLLLRRTKPAVIRLGPIMIHEISGAVGIAGQQVRMPPQEHAVLFRLARTPDCMVSNEQLKYLIGSECHDANGMIRVLVHRIRRALAGAGVNPRAVRTVYSAGYYLDADALAQPAAVVPDC